MNRILLSLLLTLSIIAANAQQRYIYLRSTPGGASSYAQLLSADIPSLNYQLPLVSGTNIKTVENLSLLGSGNVSLASIYVDLTTAQTIAGKKTLTAGSTFAALNIGTTSAAISTSLADGDLFMNNTALHLGFRLGGSLSYAMRTSATNAGNLVPFVAASTSSFYNHSGNFTFTDNITTGNGFTTASSTVTTGNVSRFASTSTAMNNGSVVSISSSGANSTSGKTANGVIASVTNTGTSSTNIAGIFTASGGTQNIAIQASAGDVVIGGTTPTAGTIFDVQSTTKAAKFPTMTNTQITAITGVEGMVGWNTTTHSLYGFNGTAWVPAGSTGITDGSAAAAGQVGEEVISTISTYTNYTTTATYQNVASITLSAGDWDLSAFFTFNASTATLSPSGNATFAISTTTASASGATEGLNLAYIPEASLLSNSKASAAIPAYRVTISSSTTYYLNTQSAFNAGNPQFVGSIRARRIR